MEKNKKYFKWILVIAWMIIIFLFSNEPAVASDKNSRFAIDILDSLGIDFNSAFGELANFILRKTAHFMEYFILYLLVFNALKKNFSLKKGLIISLIITFLYACSDEVHQLFVLGREGRFTDVLIDTLGGTFALILITIYNSFKEKDNKKVKVNSYK